MITLTILAAWSTFNSGTLNPPPPRPPAPTLDSVASPPPFKPYKAPSLYNSRGGLDPYPKPAKPKGYIDLYHPKTPSTF